MRQPRIGHINFINCLPLSYAFARGGFGTGLSIHAGVPSALNAQAVKGELDITPVSSIIYAQHAEQFLLMPDISISAPGALQSILLVSKKPIAELAGGRVALTAKSATSHALLKIILHYAYRATPDYFVSPLSLGGGVLDEAQAALFIGDEALHAYHNRIDGLYYYDIGGEWQKLTGMPMVYAVWVINRQYAAACSHQVAAVHARLTGGVCYGLEHLAMAADSVNGKVPFEAAVIQQYIGLLSYQLTERHKQALLTYYTLAWELGLIPEVPTLEFFEVSA